MDNIKQIARDVEQEFGMGGLSDGIYFDYAKEIAKRVIKQERQKLIEDKKELLIDQLQRLRGVLGNYNCKNGGRECNFQTNCHRLIENEITKLNNIK